MDTARIFLNTRREVQHKYTAANPLLVQSQSATHIYSPQELIAAGNAGRAHTK